LETDLCARLLATITVLERALIVVIKSQPENVQVDVLTELRTMTGAVMNNSHYGEARDETAERMIYELS